MANAISDMSGIMASGAPTQNTLGPMSGSNQYMSYAPGPTMAGSNNTPGIVPTAVPLPGSAPPSSLPKGTPSGAFYSSGGDVPGTNSVHLDPTMDPTLTQQYYNMLSGQVGQGLPGYNQSTQLVSSGQATAPGSVNAPLNTTDQALQAFLAGGQTNTPGANQLTQMAQTGDPVNQTPAWQAMVASEAQNTAQNANNLREQFASGGALNSSPFGNAMQQFYNQNTLNQNAQLTAATTAEGDAAAGRQLTAGQGIQSEQQQFGTEMQTLDQNAINQMMKEFYVNLPQDNPLLQNEAQAANTSPQVAGQTPTTMQNISGFISSIGSLF